MLYTAILVSHIAAACATGAVGAYALYALVRGKSGSYRLLALMIAYIAGFEVASGTLLAVISPDVTAAYLASHIALYLGACFVIELLLFVRMRKALPRAPIALAASPVCASLVLFVAALSYGF